MNNRENKEREKETSEKSTLGPDPETLHTTDPQENMEGPVSSSLKNIGGAFDSDETPDEAEEKRERHM